MVVANQLFDALTAANVPRDQAHAVVDALEHRMTSELATKADLERGIAGLRAATKADLEREIAGVKADIAATKADLEREISGVKADIAATKADLEREIAGLRAATKADLEREIAGVKIDIAKLDTKMEALHRKLTIQFGSMMIATAGMLFAALTYTNQ
mgnify:FL=1|jgi:predicted  nucleic acid-binding Zn-ribbon protein